MPSAFTHAFAAAALGSLMLPRQRNLIAFGALCAAAPDLDVIGFHFGVAYGALLGHRGVSHSLPFALLSAALLARLWPRAQSARATSPSRGRLGACRFCAIASHGVLDAFTNGGRGVALLSPLSTERYFFPWRPIEVSPISVRRFFSGRGLEVLRSEIVIVWLPALALAALGALSRRARR